MQESAPGSRTAAGGDLPRRLIEALARGEGMNDFLHRFLSAVEAALPVARLVLYDFDENVDTFELLYFHGHDPDARGELGRRLLSLDLGRALTQKEPYLVEGDRGQLLIPLYFQETLEALLLLEPRDGASLLEEEYRDAYRSLSRFLGLFMSSLRLPVNQRRDLLQLNARERARQEQMSYLPVECPVTDRYEIFGYNQSSALVGGDYFDYFCRREDTLQFIIADACGHGLPAARTICAFRELLHSEARRHEDLTPLFDRLNREIYRGKSQLRYLTGLFFDYDERSRRLSYFNAGHFAPLLVHPDGSHTHLPGGGLPLGMFEDAAYEIGRAEVREGDLLVTFTDGIVDLQSPAEAFFGPERVLESVLAHREAPLRDLARLVLSGAARFSNHIEPEDDLTLFLVRFH